MTTTTEARQLGQKDGLHVFKTRWIEGTVPVDPIRLAQALGHRVSIVVFDDPELHGLSHYDEQSEQTEILLNYYDSPNRMRFSCAHELGHFWEKRDEAPENFATQPRNKISSLGTKPSEVYANNFAAALLMPKDHVIARAKDLMAEGKGRTSMVEAMAIEYEVSVNAMGFRVEGLYREIFAVPMTTPAVQ